jgi:ABC-type branched-subunit amino acid transport system ATPase component
VVYSVDRKIAILKPLLYSLNHNRKNTRAVLRLSDCAYVLKNGKVVLEGASKSLAQDECIQQAYMGGHS